MKFLKLIIILLCVIISLPTSSCGKKGDLYLEGEEKKQVKDNEEL